MVIKEIIAKEGVGWSKKKGKKKGLCNWCKSIITGLKFLMRYFGILNL